MPPDTIGHSLFLIFSGAAVLATVALYARQSLLVADILLGALLGPWGTGWVADLGLIQDISHIGITFLLFLLGLNLHPQRLLQRLGEALQVTLGSSLLFAIAGSGLALGFGLSGLEAALVGATAMFSSTIIGLKLLPTSVLHHQQGGRLIIRVLLLQDLLAIVLLMVLRLVALGGNMWRDMLVLSLSLPALLAFAWLFQRWVLVRLLRRFDKIHEYLFLAALGWCLGMAELASSLGLSREIGAFVAGVAVATSPISLFIAESLKPLRDFFLVIFFFTLGARFDWGALPTVLPAALAFTALLLLVKPPVFRWLLRRCGEATPLAGELGVRLGQGSEFSLLVAYLAVELGLMGATASALIQTATVLSLMMSSYYIVQHLPTPIATSDRLRRD